MVVYNSREIALKAIERILDEGAYANLELNYRLKESFLSDIDKRFITELVYGTVKRWNSLDWVLSKFVSRPLEKINPIIRNILRLGTYQLLYMDRVPVSAACNESVKLTKKFGHKGTVKFVNGVLRGIAREHKSIEDVEFPDRYSEPVSHISLKYSHPEWMVERWLGKYGLEAAVKMCMYNNSVPKPSIRINTYKISVDSFTRVLESKNIKFSFSELCPDSIIIEDYNALLDQNELEGLYISQGESSTLVGHVCNPVSGSAVLDACSAPGIKSSHLAQLMSDDGMIIALDIYEHKLKLIRRNCARLGITCVYPHLIDAREAYTKIERQFDIILVDAPCMGTGVLNRRVDARWRKKYDDFFQINNLQRDILKGVVKLLKPGGRLVYSTCSLEPEDNVMITSWMLENFLDLSQENVQESLPFELSVNNKSKHLQLLPHVHNVDGFYICSFKKGV